MRCRIARPPVPFEAERQYLSGIGVHGHPAYDGYNTGSGPNEVHDGDLLAPTLLNVTPRLRGYYTLLDLRADLERWLQAIPADARLEDADKSDLASLGELLGLVDDKERTPGVGAVTLRRSCTESAPASYRCTTATFGAATSASNTPTDEPALGADEVDTTPLDA